MEGCMEGCIEVGAGVVTVVMHSGLEVTYPDRSIERISIDARGGRAALVIKAKTGQEHVIAGDIDDLRKVKAAILSAFGWDREVKVDIGPTGLLKQLG